MSKRCKKTVGRFQWQHRVYGMVCRRQWELQRPCPHSCSNWRSSSIGSVSVKLSHGSRTPAIHTFQNQWWLLMTLKFWTANALLRKKTFYGAHQKNLNKGRRILSAAKIRSMILVSRNIRYMRIFAGDPRGWASNDSGVVKERNFHHLLLAQNL